MGGTRNTQKEIKNFMQRGSDDFGQRRGGRRNNMKTILGRRRKYIFFSFL
jgi:hypothetical protein